MNKRAVVFIVFVVIGVVMFYIVTNEYTYTELSRGLTAEQRTEVALDGRETASIEDNYVFVHKTEFVHKMRKELAGIQGELTLFSAQLAKEDGPSYIEEQVSLDAARENWDRTNKLLNFSERATEFNWSTANREFRRSYAELKMSIQETRRWRSLGNFLDSKQR